MKDDFARVDGCTSTDQHSELPRQATGSFELELESLINRFSMENGSDTPDFILANYLSGCLVAWNIAVLARDRWRNQ